MALPLSIPDSAPSTPAVTAEDLRTAGLTVVHYWAVWDLNLDREMDKRISAVRPDFDGRISFRSCDVDRAENLPFFNDILNIPALGFYMSGLRFKILIGLRGEEELRRVFVEWLAMASGENGHAAE